MLEGKLNHGTLGQTGSDMRLVERMSSNDKDVRVSILAYQAQHFTDHGVLCFVINA